jgi:hypothetical protein
MTQSTVGGTERGRPVAFTVVASATPTGAGCAESAGMSLSDRDWAGAF